MRRAAPGQRTVADVEEGDLGEGAEARGGGGGSVGALGTRPSANPPSLGALGWCWAAVLYYSTKKRKSGVCRRRLSKYYLSQIDFLSKKNTKRRPIHTAELCQKKCAAEGRWECSGAIWAEVPRKCAQWPLEAHIGSSHDPIDPQLQVFIAKWSFDICAMRSQALGFSSASLRKRYES